jgi:hypothetical protein
MAQTRRSHRWISITSLTVAVAGALTACTLENATMDESLGSTAEPYAITLATWHQGESGKSLGEATSSYFCALTSIHGRFRGDGEEVRVSRAPMRNAPGRYTWFLGGTSQQSGVGAKAACAQGVDGYSGETLWSQGEPSKDLGPSDDRACFLTRIRGHFEGVGEYVRVRAFDGRWWLGGGSQQAGVLAGARCVYAPSEVIGDWRSVQSPAGGSAFGWLGAWTTNGHGAFCALTTVWGKFGHANDIANVSGPGCGGGNAGCQWTVTVQAQSGLLGAGAACLFEEIDPR